VLATIGLMTRRPAMRWIDRAILVELGVVALAIVAGGAVFVSGPGPRDPLHLVYAVAALVTLPIARFAVPSLAPGRRSGALLAGGVILIALTLRLQQTG